MLMQSVDISANQKCVLKEMEKLEDWKVKRDGKEKGSI